MPIVNGKYKNPGWTNNARPPIDAQNLNDISDTLEKLDQGGGGKRTVRAIVGTSTAGWTAADCDYLCDGTADDVEINAALTAAFQAGGGVVRLLTGDYNLTSAITIAASVTLQGDGAGATRLIRRTGNYTGTYQEMCQLRGHLADLAFQELDPPSSAHTVVNTIAPPTGCSITGVKFYTGSGSATQIRDTSTSVSTYLVIRDCIFNLASEECISAPNAAADIYVINNSFSGLGTISITGQAHAMIQGNNMPHVTVTLDGVNSDSVFSGNAAGIFKLLNSSGQNYRGWGCLVCGNIFQGDDPAITLGANTRYNFVTGNQLTYLTNGTQLTVQDNGTGNIVRFNSDGNGESGGVSSFNGRTGAVVPASGDYTPEMVGITYGTADLTPGTSSLATGKIYLVYQ